MSHESPKPRTRAQSRLEKTDSGSSARILSSISHEIVPESTCRSPLQIAKLRGKLKLEDSKSPALFDETPKKIETSSTDEPDGHHCNVELRSHDQVKSDVESSVIDPADAQSLINSLRATISELEQQNGRLRSLRRGCNSPLSTQTPGERTKKSRVKDRLKENIESSPITPLGDKGNTESPMPESLFQLSAFNNLMDEIQRLQTEKSSLKAQLVGRAVVDRSDASTKENARLRQEICQLSLVMTSCESSHKKQVDQLQDEIRHLSEQLKIIQDRSNEENIKLADENKELKLELNGTELKLDKAKEEIRAMNLELANHKASSDLFKAQLNEIQLKCNNDQQQAVADEVAELQQKLATSELNLNKLADENKDLQKKLATSESALVEVKAANRLVDLELAKHHSSIDLMNERMAEMLSNSTKTQQQYTDENKDLKEKLDALKSRLDEMAEENNDLCRKAAASEAAAVEARAENRLINLELCSSLASIDSLNKRMADMQSDFTSAEKKLLDEKKDLYSRLAVSEAAIVEMSQKLDSSEAALIEMRQKLNSSEAALVEARTNYATLEAAIGEMKQKLDSSEAASVEAKSNLATSEAASVEAKSNLATSEAAIVEMRQELDSSRTALVEVRTNHATSEAVIVEMTQKVDMLEAALSEAKVNLATSQAVVVEMAQKLDMSEAALSEARANLAKSEAVLFEVQAEDRLANQELANHVASGILLKEQIAELQLNYTNVQQQFQDLENEKLEISTELEMYRKMCMEANAKLSQLDGFHIQIRQYQTKISTMEADMAEEIRILNSAHRLEKERAVKDYKSSLLATKSTANQLVEQLSHLLISYGQLKNEMEILKSSFDVCLSETKKQIVNAIQGVSDHNVQLVSLYRREMALRKKYHNEIVSLKGNIRVLCRIRPIVREDSTGVDSAIVVNGDRNDDTLVAVNNRNKIQSYEFDRVFDSTSTQAEVFDEVRSLVTSCLDGFNVCIFAYGQTGSGKTYTMEGDSHGQAGINPRALQELFSAMSSRTEWSYTVAVCVLEIYNETLRDLLSDDGKSSVEKLKVKMTSVGSLEVPGLTWVQVESVEDVNMVFSLGRHNRTTASTNMNDRSSRSHAVLSVWVEGTNSITGLKTIGKLNLVDLAGSERVHKSGAEGSRLKEAQSINKSLSCLCDVIHALRTKQPHVPYRNSKLTYLLQDSLGGNSKTLMIVQISPVLKNVGETVASLEFAQRAKSVELGRVKPAQQAPPTPNSKFRS